MTTIFQCEHCLRYFTRENGGVGSSCLAERPLGVLPELAVCGLADCEGLLAARLESELAQVRAEQEPVVDFWKRAKAKREMRRAQGAGCAKGGQRRAVSALGSAARVLRASAPAAGFSACPPEIERPMQGQGAVHIGSSQEEFKATVDVSDSLRRLLDYFQVHYNEWIPMVTLAQVSGCHAVHSRMPELRALLPCDHDIDQMGVMYAPTGKLHSHFRLCLKTESERLKRKLKREDGQGVLPSVEVRQ